MPRLSVADPNAGAARGWVSVKHTTNEETRPTGIDRSPARKTSDVSHSLSLAPNSPMYRSELISRSELIHLSQSSTAHAKNKLSSTLSSTCSSSGLIYPSLSHACCCVFLQEACTYHACSFSVSFAQTRATPTLAKSVPMLPAHVSAIFPNVVSAAYVAPSDPSGHIRRYCREENTKVAQC